jgi:hypothetical protein
MITAVLDTNGDVSLPFGGMVRHSRQDASEPEQDHAPLDSTQFGVRDMQNLLYLNPHRLDFGLLPGCRLRLS